jgi:alpha-1,2-mannosyltransferase
MSMAIATGRPESAPLRFWAGVLVALYIAFLGALWRRGYYPLLPDFSVFWAAGKLALSGHAAAAYDWASIGRLQQAAGFPKAFFAPPFYLIAAAPLGLLSYGGAAAIWLALGLCAYLATIRAILPGATATVLALAAPPVLFNLLWGQNGLLLAGLIGGALALIDRRPWVAGVLIGLSAFKPQFGLLLPFLFALTGRWRVFAAAALSLLALSIGAGLILGWAVWAAFAASAHSGLGAYAQHGGMAGRMDWEIIGSAYGLLRTLGIAARPAMAAQIAVAAAALAAALWAARSGASPALKSAAVATAMLAAAPYSEYNDWSLLTVALAFLLADGLASGLYRWERAGMATVFVLPLACLILPLSGLLRMKDFAWLFGPILCAALAALIGRRLAVGR